MKKKLAITKPKIATLTLPPTAPPPRKEDIINAMVERARVKHEEEASRLKDRRTAANDELNAALIEELKSKPESFTVHFHGLYHTPEIEYYLEVIPPHIRKLRENVSRVPSLGQFDPATMRRKIREQFSAASSERVKALLANPDAVEALDAALAKIA